MGPGKEEIFEVGNEGLSVADVAANLALSPEQVIADLFMVGIMANVNQVRCNSSSAAACSSACSAHQQTAQQTSDTMWPPAPAVVNVVEGVSWIF